MARRNQKSFFDLFSALSWQYSVSAAILSWLVFWIVLPRVHLPGWQTNTFVQMLDHAIHQPALLRLIGFAFVTVCVMAGMVSYAAQMRRSKLLDSQSSLYSIRAMDWASFEILVGEAFRRCGYSVEETGQGGADGGVDLILKKPSELVLVQCKRWKQNVGAPVVREMYGLLGHMQATRVKIVSAAKFSKDALAFAEGKPIDLIGGEDLLQLVRSVQSNAQLPASPTGSHPTCPLCHGPMAIKTSTKAFRQFYGCQRFPACRGSRPIC